MPTTQSVCAAGARALRSPALSEIPVFDEIQNCYLEGGLNERI